MIEELMKILGLIGLMMIPVIIWAIMSEHLGSGYSVFDFGHYVLEIMDPGTRGRENRR